MRVLASLALAALLAAAAASGAGCGETTYDFNNVGTGHDDADKTPHPKSNSQYIRGLYSDLVGRAPESYDFSVVDSQNNVLITFPLDEQDFLLGTLDGVGDPTPLRALIVAGLVNSDEVDLPEKNQVDDPAAWITEQFQKFLGREPNAYELRAFVDEWDADDAVTPRTIVRALLGSREYQSF